MGPESSDLSLFGEDDGEFEPGKLPTPARLAIDVPTGYTLQLGQSPGTELGYGYVASLQTGEESGSIALVAGEITADDPARYPADPQAQACSPGPHSAVWRLSLSALGLSFDTPIFVDRPADPATAAELVLCAPVARSADGTPVGTPVALSFVALFLGPALSPPAAPGRYVWRALVTPLAKDGARPDASAAYEMRAVVPIPNALSVRGRYDARRRSAVLRGRLTAGGKPRAGVDVHVAAITHAGNEITYNEWTATTNSSGAFSFQTRIRGTTPFRVRVEPSTEPCAGSSTAPAGCVSTWSPAPPDRLVIVRVPPKTRKR